MAKMWVSELRNPWTDCHKIWQGWLYAGRITHSTKILNDRFSEAYQQQVKQYCRVIFSFFTARRYASAVSVMALRLSVLLSILPSVSSRCSIKMAKHIVKQPTPHDRLRILMKSQRDHPQLGTKNTRGLGKFATLNR